MTPAAEKKVLSFVLRRIANPGNSIMSARWFMPVVWAGLVVLAAVLFSLGKIVHPGISAIGFVLLGAVYAHLWFKAAAAKGWLVLAPHFNPESIRARLTELEA